MANVKTFKTEDGYILNFEKGVFTDGDMSFEIIDGYPVDEMGKKLSGKFNKTTFQLLGHCIETDVNIDSLADDDYDILINEISDDILDGFEGRTTIIQKEGLECNWEFSNDIDKILSENEAMTKALEALGFTQENISVIKSGEFIPQIVSDDKFKAYAVGLFTSDGENGAKDYDNLMEGSSELSVWQPFECWPMEDVASEVENTYNSLKQWFAPELVRSEESEAEDDEYRNALTCNSCASDIDLCKCKRFNYVEEDSTKQRISMELCDFESNTNVPFVEVALVTINEESFLSVSVCSYRKVLLDYEKPIHLNEGSDLSYEINGEYLHIHTHGLNEEIQIQIKSQEHDKGLIVDVYINDEECESLGYLLESDFSKITEQWCEQCAMEAKVDEHENCINCGQPTNQKLEKFECDECGCFFMVADRDDFVCPNCKSIEEE